MKHTMKRATKYALSLSMLIAVSGCDRRDDPTVDPASTGSSTPPGEIVDSGSDANADAASGQTAATRQQPEFDQTPGTATQCDGKVGDELADCVKDRDQRDPRTEPQPRQ